MLFRRIPLLLVLVLGLGLAAAPTALLADADAKSKAGKSRHKSPSKKRRGKRSKKHRKTKVCKLRNGKRRCRYKTVFKGRAFKPKVAAKGPSSEPLAKPSGELEIVPRHFKGESYKVRIYDRDGELDDGVLAELDHGFRCKRTGSERAVDPRLYETLSRIYDHFGRKPIQLISGHRNQRNEKSRHFHASAMDIHIPGVSDRRLYNYASSLDRGGAAGMGVGIYPRSGFVHIDFRAPGTKSYRWTDWSGSGKKKRRKKRKRRTRARKPVS